MRFVKGQTVYCADLTFQIRELTVQRMIKDGAFEKVDAGGDTLWDSFECYPTREAAERELLRRAKFDLAYHGERVALAQAYLASLPGEAGEAEALPGKGIAALRV